MEDNIISAGDDTTKVDKIVEEEKKEDQDSVVLLPISNEGEVINPELLPSITASGLTFKKKNNIVAHKIHGNIGFIVFFAYDKDEDLDVLKSTNVLIDEKAEEGSDRTVYLNLTKVMQQTFDWTESIVTNSDASKVNYKYIIHSVYGDVDIYITFNKGVLYDEVVDSMYSMFVSNYDKVLELKESLKKLYEEAKAKENGN